jgi:hypothetical protein
MSPVATESKQAELPMAVLLRRQSGVVKRRYERVGRGDCLPEQARYRDDGCDIHPACLTCPLPRCRYEEKGGLRAMINAYRDRQIAGLRDAGVPAEELSARFGLSKRTIFRILEMQQMEAVARARMEARCA